jgi:hypothetical protein
VSAGWRRQRALELLGEALRLLNRFLASPDAAGARGYAERARNRVEEVLQLLRCRGR